MIRAGRLRHSIDIECRQPAADDYGDPSGEWIVFASVRSSAEPMIGREYFAAQQVNSEVTMRFRIRYIAGVKAAMRIRHNGDMYDIVSVINPGGLNRELQLMARARNPSEN